eukprot:CAMPEP_0113501446 /NCGR_PEP_ID=MMETSP0014_2-20120614/32960_1 /TAXON_ID=2857 /ORGANISM="Nitzschia sp." /LENGTH=307 /DNA_ID=CAMNT_0000396037 /DNA_START=28 /DNA_END=951 /DNA_ORIENTATION=+ /assembly_acc=CAM_ASM_000159
MVVVRTSSSSSSSIPLLVFAVLAALLVATTTFGHGSTTATLCVVAFSLSPVTSTTARRVHQQVVDNGSSIHNIGPQQCRNPQQPLLQLNAEASSSSASSASSSSTKTTLDENTTWNLRMVLQNLPTKQGKSVDRIIAIRVKFIEEVGYEPPQGEVVQVMDTVEGGEDTSGGGGGGGLSPKIVSSRWQLSEDPNDRKDSLWIWGLFAEPLYPFMLLRLDFDEISLPGSATEEAGGDASATSTADAIAPFKLFAQIDHKREDGQVILSSGADLTIKQKETIKADPFGAATIDLFDDVKVGKLQIQAITK